MMRLNAENRLYSLILSLLILCPASQLFGQFVLFPPEFLGHEVGNPGDPVQLMMSQARDDARVMLVRVKAADIDDKTGDLQDWYAANVDRWHDAVRDSKHVWIDDLPGHCASAVQAEVTIYFYFTSCQQSVKNPSDAIKLILHESIHLLGIQDESFADDMANAVYAAWGNIVANQQARWRETSPLGAPIERAAHASVFFIDEGGNRQLFVYGGCNENSGTAIECSTYLGDAGIYNIDLDSWTPIPEPTLALPPQELRRAFASAVHTGNVGLAAGKIIIFGGCSGEDAICSEAYGSLLIYDLKLGEWSMRTANSAGPEGRIRHHAFWAGDHMLVWGGISEPAAAGRGISMSDTWKLDPVTWQWTETGMVNPPSPRRFSTATLIPRTSQFDSPRLMIFGGCDRQVGQYCPNYFNDGAILDLGTGKWQKLALPAIKARGQHSAVWTGDKVLIFGGQYKSTSLSDGFLFDPSDHKVELISSLLSEGRYGHSAIWAGDRMIVWGGRSTFQEYAVGVKEYYLPGLSFPFGHWTEVTAPASPVARWMHTGIWTGDSLLIWGGASEFRSYLNSGGRYFPQFAP